MDPQGNKKVVVYLVVPQGDKKVVVYLVDPQGDRKVVVNLVDPQGDNADRDLQGKLGGAFAQNKHFQGGGRGWVA